MGPMQLVTPPRHIALAGLRALKTIACADGQVEQLEQELMVAISEHVLKLGTDININALESIDAGELASEVRDPMFRERIMWGIVLVALADADLSPEEENLIVAYGNTLGANPDTLRTLKHLSQKRMRLLRLDIIRRSFIGKRLQFQWEQKGLKGMAEAYRAISGGESPELRDKYLALEQLPLGSLGRSYHQFIREAGFSFPGEKGGAPEPLVFHDCVHVLAGYGTTVREEACIAAFQGGFQKDDPLHTLLFVLAQFHLGIQISPIAGVERMGIRNIEEVIRCFMLGTQCRRDLGDRWDPWVDFETSIEELRQRYNIVLRPDRNAAVKDG